MVLNAKIPCNVNLAHFQTQGVARLSLNVEVCPMLISYLVGKLLAFNQPHDMWILAWKVQSHLWSELLSVRCSLV